MSFSPMCFALSVSMYIYVALVGFWAHILLKNLISSPILYKKMHFLERTRFGYAFCFLC